MVFFISGHDLEHLVEANSFVIRQSNLRVCIYQASPLLPRLCFDLSIIVRLTSAIYFHFMLIKNYWKSQPQNRFRLHFLLLSVRFGELNGN